jgi:rhodanese-related sulfurtransferase
MKKTVTTFAMLLFMLSIMAIGNAEAYENKTATEAMAMVVASPDNTFIVDVRTLDEYYWVGTCALNGNGMPIAYNIPYELWTYRIEEAVDASGNPLGYYKPSMVTVKNLFRLFIKKTFKPTDRVILMCRSGSRSKNAALYLEGLGYFKTPIYNMEKGFQGSQDTNGYRGGQEGSWQGDGLPMTQKLEPNKIYLYMWSHKY